MPTLWLIDSPYVHVWQLMLLKVPKEGGLLYRTACAYAIAYSGSACLAAAKSGHVGTSSRPGITPTRPSGRAICLLPAHSAHPQRWIGSCGFMPKVQLADEPESRPCS